MLTNPQRESRSMLENLRSGFGQIPQTVMGYGRNVLQSDAPLAKVGADVSALGSALYEGLKEDPVGFALDVLPVTGEIRSGIDATTYSDLANEARAANDLDAASMYEQIATMSAAGAVPLAGMGARVARRAARSGAPTAADDLAALTVRAQTETPEFKNFFGDSKVVGADGQPLVVYHGTSEDISKFKPSKEGALGSGIYTTPDSTFAGEYAKNTGANIVPVYVSLKNPLILGTNSTGYLDPMMEALTKLGLTPNKAEQLVEKAYEERGYIGKQVQSRATAQGYDGIMQYQNGKLSEVLAFSPEQVKSAIGNVGTFDPTSPVITKAQGGEASSAKIMLDRLTSASANKTH
jgi:hypothetical protein